MSGSAKLKRLQKIGETRWFAKHAALEHIFGSFHSPQPEMFQLLIKVLSQIIESPTFDASVTFQANALLDKWRLFDTHLTSFIMLNVYSTLQIASEYLQTKGIDYLSAWHMVQKAKDNLNDLDFDTVFNKYVNFIEEVNQMFDNDEGIDFVVETDFRNTRTSKRKRMADEIKKDSRSDNPKDRFRIEVFRIVLDQITTSIEERFSRNKKTHSRHSML